MDSNIAQLIDAHTETYKDENRDESATNYLKLVAEHLNQEGMIPKDFGQIIYHDEHPEDQFTFFRFRDSAHPFLVMASQTQSATLATSDDNPPQTFSDIKEAWDAFMATDRPKTQKSTKEDAEAAADEPAHEDTKPAADEPAHQAAAE